MPLLENLPGFLQICGIFGLFVPWESKKCLDISTQHTAFCRTAVHTLKPVNFFVQFVFNFLRSLKFADFFTVFFCDITGTFLAQFFTDNFKLLSQNIISLVLIHTGFKFALQIVTDLEHFDLICEDCSKYLIAVFKADCLEDFLFVLITQRNIYRDLCDQLIEILNVQDFCCQLFADFSAFHAISLKEFLNTPEHCFIQRFRIFRTVRLKKCRFCFQKRLLLIKT